MSRDGLHERPRDRVVHIDLVRGWTVGHRHRQRDMPVGRASFCGAGDRQHADHNTRKLPDETFCPLSFPRHDAANVSTDPRPGESPIAEDQWPGADLRNGPPGVHVVGKNDGEQ